MKLSKILSLIWLAMLFVVACAQDNNDRAWSTVDSIINDIKTCSFPDTKYYVTDLVSTCTFCLMSFILAKEYIRNRFLA